MVSFLKSFLLQRLLRDTRGNLLLVTMVFGAISFTLVVTGIAGYAMSEHRAARFRENSEQALRIAEAGLEYYRWHLAHDPTDYTDGTGQPGPYIHDYTNKAGVVIGKFSLVITPPNSTSTVVTIVSTGWTLNQPDTRRTIRTKIGTKALTDYAFITNAPLWVGDNMTLTGRLHSNSGIRFDGLTDSEVTSAVNQYLCQPVHGQGCNNQTKPGIWGQGGPQELWKFPVPAVDFSQIPQGFALWRAQAQQGGMYLSPSGKQGWKVTFTSNDRLTVARVTATNCYKGEDVNEKKDGWYCIDIKTADPGVDQPGPGNGVIFADDTVWVEGTVNGWITLATGSGKSIIINGNLTYPAPDGTHRLSLAADQDVLVPHDSPDDLTIHAALLTNQGATKRYYYQGDMKKTLTTFGSLISSGIWTWSWISQGGAVVSGYRTVNVRHDPALLYNPPVGFPRGTEQVVLLWEEIK